MRVFYIILALASKLLNRSRQIVCCARADTLSSQRDSFFWVKDDPVLQSAIAHNLMAYCRPILRQVQEKNRKKQPLTGHEMKKHIMCIYTEPSWLPSHVHGHRQRPHGLQYRARTINTHAACRRTVLQFRSMVVDFATGFVVQIVGEDGPG